MSDKILSLDVGTTAAKAVMFSLDGQELHVAERTFPLLTPKSGWAELNPGDVWKAVLDVLTEMGQLTLPGKVLALALATQGGSFIASDEFGNPISPIITWMDQRSALVVDEWRQNGVGDRIRQISGWNLDPGLPAPMMSWLKREVPDAFKKSHHLLSVNDFLTYRLTGIYATNPSMAGEMLIADLSTGRWSEEICQLVNMDMAAFSPIHPSEAIIGELCETVSLVTGLQKGIPLVNGGQDHSCEALAMGITDPGTALLSCGTAWVINCISLKADMAAIPSSMNLNFHVLPNRWIASQFLGGLGGMIEWWVGHFWQNADATLPLARNELFAHFNEAVQQTRPGGHGLIFVPLDQASNTIDGANYGGFWGLQLHHGRPEMSRGLLESAGFEVRSAIESIRLAGMEINQLWMVGGGTRSPVLPAIVADITGMPVSLTSYSHGPALGAAMLAVKGLGLFDNWEDVRQCFPLTYHQVEPDPMRLQLYEKIYQHYLDVSRKLLLI